MRENQCYLEALFQSIVQKRIRVKEECFAHIHKDIVPLLSGLREKGLKVGLISNCFSEETEVIRKSVLFPYFDVTCLSYEQGIQKPDAAQAVGMKAVQAVWYLRAGTNQPCGRKEGFLQAGQQGARDGFEGVIYGYRRTV